MAHKPVVDVSGETGVDVGEEGRDDRQPDRQDQVALVAGQLRVERHVPVQVHLQEHR